MVIKETLYCTVFAISLLGSTIGSASSLMDINAQNDVVTLKMKVRLSFQGVQQGLHDNYCTNIGGPFVQKDKNGNFLEFIDQEGNSYYYHANGLPITYFSEPLKDKKLEAQRIAQQTVINAWGTISYTKQWVGSVLNEILPPNSFAMNAWNQQDPVKLYTLDNGGSNNAFFKRDSYGGSIHFLPLVNTSKQVIGSTANDFDVVSHETGHNISYILRPDRDFNRPQTGAIDEFLGDFIASSTALSLTRVRNKFLKETGGNLHKSSFLSEAAETVSQAVGLGTHGIRNAFNKFAIGDTSCEVHDLSCILTGALYDIFVMAFEDECPRGWLWGCYANEYTQKNELTRVNKDLLSIVLAGHCFVRYTNPSFSDFGKAMHDFASSSTQHAYLVPYIENAFEQRGIDIFQPHHNWSKCDITALKKYGSLGSKDNHICGTHERMKS